MNTRLNVHKTIRTTRQDNGRWKDYGDFSIHWGDEVANVNPHYKKEWREVNYQDSNYFNSYQYFLYRRALYGLDVYNREEIEYMSYEKKKRVANVHTHVTFVLNMYKQRILVYITNRIFRRTWGKSEFFNRDGKCILDTLADNKLDTDSQFEVGITFEQLGVNRRMLAGELIEKRCLPWDFFELTINNDPRMIRLRKPEGKIDEL